MVITPPSREGSLIFTCAIEATAPNLFKEGHPKRKLQVEDALTTIYLIVIVLAKVPSEKVMLKSMYPLTST